jgi:amino acid transporter
MKVIILLVFIGVGIWGVDSSRLEPMAWSSPVQLIAGGMIIFLAYEGFELIANTAQDVRNPATTLPRAFYASVGFVIVLYVLVAIITVGSLPVDTIVKAKDYALAEAARPSLGHTGFVLIAIAAMLSTASAINATVYGAARLSYVIAKDGELPDTLEQKAWGVPIEGLLITSGMTILIANLVDLSSISTMGSAGFLLIFAAVNSANAVMAKDTGSRRWLSLVGAGLCLGALASLIWQTWVTSPAQIWFLVAMLVAALSIELTFRLYAGREINLPKI